MATTLGTWDIVVVVIYFLIIIGIGLYASCKSRRGTVSGYYLAGRSMNFIMIGFSLFVSNVGTEHFIGVAGTAAASGIGVGAWEFIGMVTFQVLGFVFLPVYLASKIRTTPEYLAKRFGGQRLRVYFSTVSLLTIILTKCSVGLFAGGVFIQQALGWDLNLSMAVLILIVAFLTIAGGLTAVIYTDTFQCLLMVAGASTVTALGLQKVGGFDGLWRKYPLAVVNTTGTNCTGGVHPEWDRMLRGLSDPDFPWLGFILGGIPTAIWYVCVDQVMAQRCLSTKNITHGQAGSLLNAAMKCLPFFLLAFPGMISRVLYTDEVACVDPDKCFAICENRAGCSNIAFPKLVLDILPTGLKGLILSVMVAALMSGLDSIFNSSSAIFVVDIWSRVRKSASVREQMVVGRLFMLVMAGLAIAWVPVLKELNAGQLFLYLNEVQNYIAPPLAAVFLLAIFWPRFNEKGAFWGLILSLILGLTRLIMSIMNQPPEPCSGLPDTRPSFLKDIPYLYIAAILYFLTTFSGIIISLCSSPPEYKLLHKTTFWTKEDQYDKEEVLEGRFEVIWGWFNMKGVERVIRDRETGFPSADPIETVYQLKAPTVDLDDICPGEKITGHKYSITHAENDGVTIRSCKGFFLDWICGVYSGKEETEMSAQIKRDDEACSLKQDAKTKWILHILAAVVAVLGIIMFMFWTLWKYNPQ